ncbi:ATP-binding protein [candidate division CSSED10-310 bacterium]|uniref:histidine kinase n=1 Tax=candidate division CSSED10-310 bacterium TaxID=2855610 RepID=A0ABV6YRT8_UNCC1
MNLILRLKLPEVDENAFRKYYYENSLATNRIATVLAFILYALFGILDIWVVPLSWSYVWLIRYALACPFLIVILIVTYSRIFETYYQILLGLSVLVLAAGILGMIILTRESELAFYTYYAGLMLVLIGNFVLYRIRFRNSIIVAALILLGYEVIAIVYQDVLRDYYNAIVFINNNFFFITSIVIGLFSNYFIEFYMRRDFNNQKMLRQRAIELEAHNAELDSFAHTVAHDLKNPLTALIGYSDFLKKSHTRIPPAEVGNALSMIARNGRKMTNIIEELLLLSLIRKKEDIDLNPLNMSAIVSEVQVRLSDMITKHQTRIIEPETWPQVWGYSPWIEEVWVNYISNAIKYGGQPPLVTLGAGTETSDLVRFWVRDNGSGIPVEQQERLFTPFERLDQVDIKGHGLGLSIVRRIIEKLGGQVGVESVEVPGQGSTFFFTLPALNRNIAT